MELEELQKILDNAEQAINNFKYEESDILINQVLNSLSNQIGTNETNTTIESIRANSFYALAKTQRMQGNFVEALKLVQQTIELMKEYSLKNIQPKVYNLTGTIYLNLGVYEKALEYFQNSLSEYESLGQKSYSASTLGLVGNVYNLLGFGEKALEYYKSALSINEELDDKIGIANLTGNIGDFYGRIGNDQMAFEYLYRSLELHEQLEQKLQIANVSGNLGSLYYSVNQFEKALDFLTRALSMNEELGDNLGIAVTTGNLGLVYSSRLYEFYNAKKAEDLLKKAIVKCEEVGSKHLLSIFYKSLSALYENEKQWEDAYLNFKKHIEIENEVRSKEANNKANQYEQQKEVAVREKEIEIAKASAAARMNATTMLLHKVLPESISTRMINGEENISDYFPSVSIFFADIQGFTAISANMKAIDVVRFLNFVFGEFDRVMKEYGCEKIKTIGDGYMAVAGAPIECEDHAERLTAAALEIQSSLILPDEIRQTMPEGSEFGIRIGMHTGPVVAGVIGQERFVYDIHSDAVNLASRMESSGEVNKVHVSAEFAAHLQKRFSLNKDKNNSIHFEDRGEMNIKGKGLMKTYFLEKEK